jgi:hypothetical protein
MTRQKLGASRDLAAAVKAVVAAGLAVARVDIDRAGNIRIATVADGKAEPAEGGDNEWDNI